MNTCNLENFSLKLAKSTKPPPERSIGAEAPSMAASQAACKNSSLVSTRLAALAATFSGDKTATDKLLGR